MAAARHAYDVFGWEQVQTYMNATNEPARALVRIPRPPPTPPGFVLVLNGCSSSGKSSIATVLQRSQPLTLLHLRLDAFRAMEPEGYFGPDQRDRAPLRVAALCRAMHAAAREYARHGQNVILDHVLSAEAWQYLLEDFADLPIYLVAVQCELAELERREAERLDRTPGLARSQWSHVHKGGEYDCVVDTTRATATACAAQMLAWLQHRPMPHAYTSMCETNRARLTQSATADRTQSADTRDGRKAPPQ